MCRLTNRNMAMSVDGARIAVRNIPGASPRAHLRDECQFNCLYCLLWEGQLLAVSHYGGNRSKSNHWNYTKPTKYTSIGVSEPYWVATSDRLPPVNQQRWKSRRQLFCPDWGSKFNTCGFNWNNKGGYSHHNWSIVMRGRLLAGSRSRGTNTGVVGGFGIIPVIMYTLQSIASAVANFKHSFPSLTTLQSCMTIASLIVSVETTSV